MLNYIATSSISSIIQNVCKGLNILILGKQENEVNLNNYIKESKLNFNLIKYFIIDLTCLTDTKEQVVESIIQFSKLYKNAKIIIIASGYDDQDIVLTSLYEIEIYNIINSIDNAQIENELKKCMLTGLQKKDSKRFEKQIIKIKKESKVSKILKKIKIPQKDKKEKVKKDDKLNNISKAYVLEILLEAVTRFVKFISYVMIFVLTSIALTVLLNQELRNNVFQILGLK
jgi:hypothetical protein